MIADVDTEHFDIYDAGEAIANLAYWEAADYHGMLWSMKSATPDLFATGLYHLTEQQLVALPLTMLRFHQLKEVLWKRRSNIQRPRTTLGKKRRSRLYADDGFDASRKRHATVVHRKHGRPATAITSGAWTSSPFVTSTGSVRADRASPA